MILLPAALSQPCRITLAPAAVGKWQLLTVLDNSLNTQQALGATEKDTDDVIRLMAETPLWLLGVTFVVVSAPVCRKESRSKTTIPTLHCVSAMPPQLLRTHVPTAQRNPPSRTIAAVLRAHPF